MIRFTNVHMHYDGSVDALKNINPDSTIQSSPR